MKQRELDVALDKLLLDPNNYRFQADPRFQHVRESRYAEETVQRRTAERISSEGLAELKASILHNGFLTFEKIIVRPWAESDEYFVVVEGNRRLAACAPSSMSTRAARICAKTSWPSEPVCP